MSTTSVVAQQLSISVMKTATDNVKHKLNKETFLNDALKHVYYDSWSDNEKERFHNSQKSRDIFNTIWS